MEHKPLDHLRSVADVQTARRVHTMTRAERLDRWITLLERDPTRRLNSLPEIEYRPQAERALLRSDDSPLTVAFNDPVLREEGLSSDRLGDGMTFFEMTEHEAHHALCSCLGGRTMEARAFAQRIRGATSGFRAYSGAWAAFGIAVALPSLLYFLE